jgi:nitrous oxidase accessory protein NosD
MNNKNGTYFCCGAQKNIVYNNVFMNNFNWNAKDDLGNIWDNGKVGNYWDDYNGIDEDGDGIGDTSYIISGGDDKDNFPLIKPFNNILIDSSFIINSSVGKIFEYFVFK